MADDRERGYGRREGWRERESSIFSDDDDRWGRGSGRWSGEQGRGRGGDDDRGFFERAGDEVRSWFGDDDAERRRERDLRREEVRGAFGGRDDDDRAYSRGSSEGRSGGFRGGYGFSSESGGPSDWERGGRERAGWGSGFDRDRSERSDRGDRGDRGFGGPSYDRGTGSSQRFGSRSEQGSGAFGGGRSQWDDNYRRWRDQQIQQFDREYDDYCRERQGQFEQEFDSWRSSRLTEGGTGAGASIQTGGGSATGYSGDSTRNRGNVGGTSRSTGSEGAGTTGGGGTGSAIGSSTGSTGAAQETGSRVGAGEGEGGGRGRGGRSRT